MAHEDSYLEIASDAELERSRHASRQRDKTQMSVQRGQMLQAMQNTENALRENEQLKEEIKELTALANTTMVQSVALLRTINHLKRAWHDDAPDSTARQDAVDGLENQYKQHCKEIREDPECIAARDKAIEQSKNSAKTQVKARRGMRR